MTIWFNDGGRRRDTGVFSNRELEQMHTGQVASPRTVDCICGHTHAHKSRCRECVCTYGTDNQRASDRAVIAKRRVSRTVPSTAEATDRDSLPERNEHGR